jgi:hypothetical protein
VNELLVCWFIANRSNNKKRPPPMSNLTTTICTPPPPQSHHAIHHENLSRGGSIVDSLHNLLKQAQPAFWQW